MDRRTTLKWIIAIGGGLPAVLLLSESGGALQATTHFDNGSVTGYGPDPNLQRLYAPGELWPLTLDARRRELVAVLCDLIIPADDTSPSASAVGVVDFIDEWVSAPYPEQRQDRELLLGGLTWLDGESKLRFGLSFAELDARQQLTICDDICCLDTAGAHFIEGAKFFRRLRFLSAGGFYTTTEGHLDLQYVGNVPLAHFDGPPAQVLQLVGLEAYQ